MNGSENPPDLPSQRFRASELLDRRRVAAARSLLAKALGEHPGDAGLLYELARADYLEDRHDDARAALGQVLATDPDDADARFLLFWVALDRGLPAELVEAEDLILGLLRQYPQRAAYFAAYARLMLRTLHFDKAAALCQEALRLAPGDTDCLRAQALCNLVHGRRGADNGALVQLIAADPQDLATLRLVVAALNASGRSREALRLARELLRAQPDDPHLLNYVREMHRLNHFSMLPLYPLQRWGLMASVALWAGAVAGGMLVREHAPQYGGLFTTVVLGYVVYSWVWPPLLNIWMKRFA
jgi:tetratricopeptide (TPR) repeat protein